MYGYINEYSEKVFIEAVDNKQGFNWTQLDFEDEYIERGLYLIKDEN